MEIQTKLSKICDQDVFLELKPQSKIPLENDSPNQGKHLGAVLLSGGNVCLILGSISGILDIDLDCVEARALADVILPGPFAIFDRTSSDSGL